MKVQRRSKMFGRWRKSSQFCTTKTKLALTTLNSSLWSSKSDFTPTYWFPFSSSYLYSIAWIISMEEMPTFISNKIKRKDRSPWRKWKNSGISAHPPLLPTSSSSINSISIFNKMNHFFLKQKISQEEIATLTIRSSLEIWPNSIKATWDKL